jgi:DNA mismatch repair protein MSH4
LNHFKRIFIMGDNFKFRKHRSKRRRKSSSVDVDGRPQDLESKTAGQDAGFGLEAPSSDEEVETNSTIRQQEHQHTQTGLYGGRRSSTGSSYQIRRSWDFASSNKENTNAEIPPSRSGGSVSVASSSRRNNPYARLKRSSSRLSSRHSLSSRGGSISIASATSSARMPQAAVHIVCAIAENLARETCVASLDAGTPISLQVTKQGNGQTYAETLAYLEMLQPHEILLNEGRKNSQLARKILQLYGYSDGGALNHADVLSGVYKDDSASTNSNTNGNGAAGAGIINDPNDPSSRGRTVIKFISRALFDQTKGAELLRKLAREDSYDSTVAEEYILLSSANAVLTYTQQNLGASISRRCLDLIINSGGNNRMAIDRSTLLQLELLANAKTGKTRQSLIATIDHTKTTVGSRLLRTNLMAPPCRADTIQARLDLVDTFLSSEDFFYTVLDHLESLPDIDKMLTNVAMVPKKTVRYKKGGGGEEVVVTERMASRGISALVCIKTTLAALPSFTTALVDQLSQLMANSGDTANQDDGMTAVTGRSSLLIGLGGGPQSTQAPKRHHLLQAIIFAMQQPALKEVLDSIADIFTESTTFTRNSHAMRHQECFALKSTSGEEDAGDGMMDILRKAFLRNVDDIHAKADEYAETHGIHVAVKYSTARGYFLSLPAEMAPTLPTIFIQPTKSGNAIHCTTEEVHSLNIRARDNVQDLLIMTHDRIQEVLAFARSKYDALASLSDAIALLDLCHGFADNVTMSKLLWCRPIITGDSTEDDASVNDPCTLAIRNGRYAIDVTGTGLVTMDGPGDTIPNDTYANADKYFTVISGINGSGKSQYLKQVAIIVLLGHCGSYVPAEQASIPVSKRYLRLVSFPNQ